MPSDGPRCARQNKACLTNCLVFMLYTVSLVRALLITATGVPEAFQPASQVQSASMSSPG